MFLGFGGFGIQTHVEFFLDGQPQLKGVDRIQAQAFTKQGGSAVDVSRLDILQLQTRDDQLFQLLFQRVHASLSPH